MSETNIPFEKIITNVTAYGIAVDSKKDIIFVTTDTELMLCDTTPSSELRCACY